MPDVRPANCRGPWGSATFAAVRELWAGPALPKFRIKSDIAFAPPPTPAWASEASARPARWRGPWDVGDRDDVAPTASCCGAGSGGRFRRRRTTRPFPHASHGPPPPPCGGGSSAAFVIHGRADQPRRWRPWTKDKATEKEKEESFTAGGFTNRWAGPSIVRASDPPPIYGGGGPYEAWWRAHRARPFRWANREVSPPGTERLPSSRPARAFPATMSTRREVGKIRGSSFPCSSCPQLDRGHPRLNASARPAPRILAPHAECAVTVGFRPGPRSC